MHMEYEEGERDHQPHIQGFMSLNKDTYGKNGTPKAMLIIKLAKIGVPYAWLDAQRADGASNEKYCTKWHQEHPDDYFFRRGDIKTSAPGRGFRTDLKKALEQYHSIGELILNDPTAAAHARSVANEYYML